jgi:hypothetical protein
MSTLQALSDLLRDRTKWPDTFIWDFGDFDTCAIGLACRAGLIDRAVRPADVLAADLGIDEPAYWRLFVSSNARPTTATDIAERIDLYLRHRAIPCAR